MEGRGNSKNVIRHTSKCYHRHMHSIIGVRQLQQLAFSDQHLTGARVFTAIQADISLRTCVCVWSTGLQVCGLLMSACTPSDCTDFERIDLPHCAGAVMQRTTSHLLRPPITYHNFCSVLTAHKTKAKVPAGLVLLLHVLHESDSWPEEL